MTYATAQHALTFAFNAVAIVGMVYLTLAFIAGAIARFIAIGEESPNPQEVEQLRNDNDEVTLEELDEFDIRMAEIALQFEDEAQEPEIHITDLCNVLPFTRRQQPEVEDYSTWTVPELRSLFNRKGWAWRNAGCDGKHLRKAEMLNLLMEVA